MALTSAQKMLVRAYMGYSVAGIGTSLYSTRELAYSDVSFMGVSLDGSTDQPNGGRLNNLTADEENRITTFYLPNLQTREQDIQDATSNLDTDIAAVWHRNKNEIGDRVSAYTALRIELCRFLGFPPGSGLKAGGTLVRG